MITKQDNFEDLFCKVYQEKMEKHFNQEYNREVNVDPDLYKRLSKKFDEQELVIDDITVKAGDRIDLIPSPQKPETHS